MNRKRNEFGGNTRKLTSAQLLEKFDEGLQNLEHLTKVYDDGYSPIAFTMATEINRILTENIEATKLRGTRIFSSPDIPDETRMLNALHRLSGIKISNFPPILEFVPVFIQSYPTGVKQLDFRTWWNREVIYRASAAPPGTPAGMIPVNNSPSVPFNKREKITRRELVAILRNKVSAHQEEEYPLLLDEIEETLGFCSFQIETPGGVFSTDDGSLPTKTGPLAAMMRQIAHELLVAYERLDK